VTSKTNLLDVVATLHPPCSFAGGLNRWQKQTDQNSYDGDNNQKLDERKRSPSRRNKAFHNKPRAREKANMDQSSIVSNIDFATAKQLQWE